MTISVFLDVETVPTDNPEVIKRLIENVKPPGQYKKEDSIRQWWASEGEAKKAEAVQRTALDGSYGKIAVIGFQVGLDQKPRFITTREMSEQEAIDMMTEVLLEEVPRLTHSVAYVPEQVTYVAHNAQFDLRFLWKRSRITNAQLPPGWPLERYSKHVYDTMTEWCGYGEYIKQTELESILGIIRPSDVDGSDVADLIAAGDWETVERHCCYDVQNLATIYRRLTA